MISRLRDADKRFARRVAALRVRQGMSQRDLALRMETHPSTVAKIELGDRAVTVGEAWLIADILGVPLAGMCSSQPLVITTEV